MAATPELLDQPPEQVLPLEELGAIVRRVSVVDLDPKLSQGHFQEPEQFALFLFVELESRLFSSRRIGRH
jgi:hypothetical protein